jgi:hypothetical protein
MSCDCDTCEERRESETLREILRRRLELRRCNAAVRHRNRYREDKRPGKGNRQGWRKDLP